MEFPNARVIVFAKAPEPGRAKTRLIPALGPEGAAALHERLVEHTLQWTTASALTTVELHCAPSVDHPFFTRCAERHGVKLRDQLGTDLGERMAGSLEHALGEVERALLIGTDCPWLSADDLRRAFQALERSDAVVGPAEDGGYVLIGLNRPAPELFRAVPWGSSEVLAATRERAAAHGLRLDELSPLPDLDRPEDLARFRAAFPDLASDPAPYRSR